MADTRYELKPRLCIWCEEPVLVEQAPRGGERYWLPEAPFDVIHACDWSAVLERARTREAPTPPRRPAKAPPPTPPPAPPTILEAYGDETL